MGQMEVQVEEEEIRMIKLKDLYPNQVSFNKKKYFGETSEEPVTESIKVIPSNKIDFTFVTITIRFTYGL